LLGDKIMQELHLDQLSDAPSNCESEKSSNNDDDDDFGPSTSQESRKRARLEVSVSDVIEDDDDDVDDGCSKNDDLRNLEQVLGNTSLTFTPNHPISITELVNRFLGNNSHEILVEQSNIFFFLWRYSPISGLGLLRETLCFTSVSKSRTVGRTPLDK
jgi:hypothetical protein